MFKRRLRGSQFVEPIKVHHPSIVINLAWLNGGEAMKTRMPASSSHRTISSTIGVVTSTHWIGTATGMAILDLASHRRKSGLFRAATQ